MSKNDKEFYYGINGIFERFPELIPAVGEHYYREDGLHKKLMLVAESNYLGVSDEKSVFRNAEVCMKVMIQLLLFRMKRKLTSRIGNMPIYNTPAF